MKRSITLGTTLISLCACTIAWTANAAGYSPQKSAQAQARPLTAGVKQAPFKGIDVTKVRCIDAWFRFLPGNPDYCYGIHKWAKGNYKDALFDLKDAAGWANKNAQYALGLIYFNGHHVTENRPLGLAWLLLSAERKKPQHYVNVAVSAYRLATPDERKQALALYKKMRPRYGDAFAAHRAKLHYQRAIRSSIWMNEIDGSTLQIAGLNPYGTPTQFVLVRLHKAERTYFKHLPEGHVTVGPLKQIGLKAPGDSAD
jgi:hypothetical protein